MPPRTIKRTMLRLSFLQEKISQSWKVYVRGMRSKVTNLLTVCGERHTRRIATRLLSTN